MLILYSYLFFMGFASEPDDKNPYALVPITQKENTALVALNNHDQFIQLARELGFDENDLDILRNELIDLTQEANSRLTQILTDLNRPNQNGKLHNMGEKIQSLIDRNNSLIKKIDFSTANLVLSSGVETLTEQSITNANDLESHEKNLANIKEYIINRYILDQLVNEFNRLAIPNKIAGTILGTHGFGSKHMPLANFLIVMTSILGFTDGGIAMFAVLAFAIVQSEHSKIQSMNMREIIELQAHYRKNNRMLSDQDQRTPLAFLTGMRCLKQLKP